MNKLLLSAALCLVMAAPSAMAQPDRNWGHQTSQYQSHRDDHRGPNTQQPGFNGRHDNRHAAPAHVRRDYSKWRRAVHSPRRFHAGVYHAPRGYVYRRWNYGQFLPSIYWARSYWLTNFTIYGLFAPPPDTVWVRYGPDALLIDRFTGEIISVQYNAFY